MKTYWKNFTIGSVAMLVLFVVGGLISDRRTGGDAAGALTELWIYLVLGGVIYSLIKRPWRNQRG